MRHLPDDEVPAWLSRQSSPWFEQTRAEALVALGPQTRAFVDEVVALPGAPARFLRPGAPTGDLVIVRGTVGVQIDEVIEVVVVFGELGNVEFGHMDADARFADALSDIRARLG